MEILLCTKALFSTLPPLIRRIVTDRLRFSHRLSLVGLNRHSSQAVRPLHSRVHWVRKREKFIEAKGGERDALLRGACQHACAQG